VKTPDEASASICASDQPSAALRTANSPLPETVRESKTFGTEPGA
jgi:hypothetical protein